MKGYASELYKRIMAEERAELYATPKRCAEIERQQPEATEWGRALFYRPGTVTGTVKERTGKSRPVEEEPELEVPTWRKTFEFTGDEDALVDDDGDSAEAAEEVFAEAA